MKKNKKVNLELSSSMKCEEKEEKRCQEGRNPEDYSSLMSKEESTVRCSWDSGEMSFECVGREPFYCINEDSVVCVWWWGDMEQTPA